MTKSSKYKYCGYRERTDGTYEIVLQEEMGNPDTITVDSILPKEQAIRRMKILREYGIKYLSNVDYNVITESERG